MRGAQLPQLCAPFLLLKDSISETSLEKRNFREYTDPHCALPRTYCVHERLVTGLPWNEPEVVARIRQGDKGALVRVYDEYSGLVYGVALRVLHNEQAAEDVAQEVFLQLWRSPSAFDDRRGRLAPWLAVITRHKAVDLLRKRRFEAGSQEHSPLPEPVASDKRPDCVADAEKAKALMARLPAEQRKVLELAFLDGLTHVEIAARIGEPLGTVKSRIRLGLLFLRKELAT